MLSFVTIHDKKKGKENERSSGGGQLKGGTCQSSALLIGALPRGGRAAAVPLMRSTSWPSLITKIRRNTTTHESPGGGAFRDPSASPPVSTRITVKVTTSVSSHDHQTISDAVHEKKAWQTSSRTGNVRRARAAEKVHRPRRPTAENSWFVCRL